MRKNYVTDSPPRNPWEPFWWCILLGLFLFVLGILLTGCRTKQELVENRSDSVRTEIRYEKVLVPDTILVEIPAQSASVVTEDSVSHLETDYAVSDASIEGGRLHHSLANKAQEKPVAVQKEIERRDSIIYKGMTILKTKTVTKEVARPYSWWDKTRFYALYAALAALVFAYRKKIWALVQLFI